MSAGLDLVTGQRLAVARDRRFFGSMAAAVAVMVFAGFARTYFATLVGLAVYWRSRSRIHKRLMLLGTIALLPPALFRIPGLAAAGLPVVADLPVRLAVSI